MTDIEWAQNADGSRGRTWNPIVGCSIKSPGCKHCYAMKEAFRLAAMGQARYDGTVKKVNGNVVWTGKLVQAPEATLHGPLFRKKPTTYFVNSMSDLFHENLPDDWIDQVFAVMALSPQHTFQVLTKRSARMRAYLSSADFKPRLIATLRALRDRFDAVEQASGRRRITPAGIIGSNAWAASENLEADIAGARPVLPLPNVWLGVSTERQQEADERIPDLLRTPAAVRFISAEPLLGSINLDKIWCDDPGEVWLDWVITGGESGQKARPANPQWFRDIRDQCHAAGVAYFHKQNGAWVSVSEIEGKGEHFHFPDGRTVRKVGKAKAGRTIDGVEYSEMPRRAA
ncbi:protein gp37 [Bradyrhizobium embrapense]